MVVYFSHTELPHGEMLQAGKLSLENISHAREKLSSARDKYVWQYTREVTLEQIAQAPPLVAPPMPPSMDNESKEAAQLIVDRRKALNSALITLEASKANVAAAKETVETKVSALRNSDQSWRENVAPNATAASLHAQANDLDAATAASEGKRVEATARAEAARLRLAALAEERQSLAAQASALEARVGANSASADSSGAENPEATPKNVKEGKKRSLAVANLVAGNREASDAAEFFAALTSCLEALSGVKVEACEEDTTSSSNSSSNANVLVRLKLWGRHKLTLTLGPRPTNTNSHSGHGGSGPDALVGAELETDFAVEEQRLSLGGVQPLATPWLTCVPRGSRAAERAVGVVDLLKAAQQLHPCGQHSHRPAKGGEDVQLVVREAAARLAAWPERLQHIADVKAQWQCPVNPSARGVTITLPVGVVATLRLSPDYPRSSGAVVVEALNGIENWRDSDLALLCDDLNKTQWHTLAQLLDVLNARLTHTASKMN